MRNLYVVNRSTVVPPAEFLAGVKACQIQASRDFSPLWGGLSVQLYYVTVPVASPYKPPGESITLLDDSDVADALGYHTTETGAPEGFVFVKTTIAAGERWESCLSHELLEQLADPYCQCVAIGVLKRKLAAISFETCDPVEADEYEINGVPVSNFVTPAYFQDSTPPGVRLDYLNNLKAPLTLTKGGYLAYLTTLSGQWQQIYADRKRLHRQAPPHRLSRSGKRMRRVAKSHQVAQLVAPDAGTAPTQLA